MLSSVRWRRWVSGTAMLRHWSCFAVLWAGVGDSSELSTGGWNRSPDNPVLSLSERESFDSENIFAPAIIKHDKRYFLYYSGGPSGPRTGEEYVHYQLGLATSDDGVHFTRLGTPLLPLGTRDDFHVTPALLRNADGSLCLDADGNWHMVFCGNRMDDLEHATSRDGIHWEKDAHSPIFRRAYSPCLLKVGNKYRLYYIHKPPGRPWEIHFASGSELHSLKAHPKNPIATITQDWEKQALFYPYVLQDRGTWVMFYAAYWKTGQTAIGTATSMNGVDWEKNPANPVFTPDPKSNYDRVYVSSQSVLRDESIYRMYYAGRIDSIHKYYSVSLATKPAGE